MASIEASLPRNGDDIRDIVFRQVYAQALTESPFTFKTQIVGHLGDRWEVDIALRTMDRDTVAPWLGFLTSMEGIVGTFFLPDKDGIVRFAGSPTLNGAHEAGVKTITIQGLSDALIAGDLIQIGSFMYQLASTVPAGGGSTEIFPRLRNTQSGGAAVITNSDENRVKGLFRLAVPGISYPSDWLKHYRISFTAVEAI